MFSSFSTVNPKPEKLPDEFIYIDLECVSSGELHSKKIEFVGTAPSRAQRTLVKNDVLFQTVRPYQQNNYFHSHTNINNLPCVASTGYAVFRTKNNARFLYALIHTNRFLSNVLKRCTGSNYPSINGCDIENITIFYPVLQEQEKIGTFLYLMDKKIEKTKLLIETLKKYKRGVLSATFNKNICSWDATQYPFFELATKRNEKYDPRSGTLMPCIELEHIEQESGRIIGNVPSVQQNSIKTVCKAGDILFGKLRPYLRKYAYIQKDMVCSSEIWSLIPSEILIPEYLFYLVQTDEFIRAANISSGTKMPRAEWSNVKKTVFYIPNKDIQIQISQLLQRLDLKIFGSIDLCEKLHFIKDGLLQQLFI